MASYPSLPQLIGTSFNPRSGMELSRSVSGRPRIKTFYSKDWAEGRIIHDLNQSELDTLMDFYAANKGVSFVFTYAADQVNYNCQFVDRPMATPKAGAHYDVEVRIVEI